VLYTHKQIKQTIRLTGVRPTEQRIENLVIEGRHDGFDYFNGGFLAKDCILFDDIFESLASSVSMILLLVDLLDESIIELSVLRSLPHFHLLIRRQEIADVVQLAEFFLDL
jgi:hypothetical protein